MGDKQVRRVSSHGVHTNLHSCFYDYNFMKRTISRKFDFCRRCDGRASNSTGSEKCIVCKGEGKILLEETIEEIEESDDMKEFIEKKCGWELVEGKERVLRYGKPFLSKTDNCSCWKKIAHIAGLECYWGEMWKEKQDQF